MCHACLQAAGAISTTRLASSPVARLPYEALLEWRVGWSGACTIYFDSCCLIEVSMYLCTRSSSMALTSPHTTYSPLKPMVTECHS